MHLKTSAHRPLRAARTTRATRAIAATAIASSLLLGAVACTEADSASSEGSATGTNAASDGANQGGSQQSNAAFPVTIKHAYGETTIKEEPKRIATVGWANHEVPMALGQAPVGISKATFGDDDDNGILPWVEEKLAELGADSDDKKPVLFDETDGIPFEQVADTKPDVILASYSGITQEDFDTLSKIAPVIAYPNTAWGTSLAEMITLNATAIGKKAEGEQLVKDLDQQVADAMDKHPELKGKNVMFTSYGASTDPSKFGFYSVKDPRMGFLAEHGFGIPKVVQRESDKSDQFWVEVSTEKPENFEDIDVMISYSSGDAEDDAKTLADMQADPLLSKIPAIAEGKVVFLEEGPLGAAANPSPLAIPWGIDRYFSELAKGIQGQQS